MSRTGKSTIMVIFIFGIVYFILDLFLFTLFALRVINIFRAIFFIYMSNFLIIPVIGLSYSIYNLIKTKKYRPNLIVLSISVILLSVFCYATYIEPQNIKIDTWEIVTDKVKKPLTIAHISDVQAAKVGKYEEKAFKILAELEPDIIFHTGDLVQPYDYNNYEKELIKVAGLFKKLSPKYGIFNVIGNVDDPRLIRLFDKTSGVKTIINENKITSGQGFRLNILGLSFQQSANGDRNTIIEWMNKPGNEFQIILGHAPDYVLNIMDCNIDLCLAGHTHGGQVNVPFLGPLLNASRTPKKWASGFRKINNIYLNVSSGIGTEHLAGLPPIRFNCPPTISIIKLVPEGE